MKVTPLEHADMQSCRVGAICAEVTQLLGLLYKLFCHIIV